MNIHLEDTNTIMAEITSYDRESLIQLFTNAIPYIDQQYDQFQQLISLTSSYEKDEKNKNSFFHDLIVCVGITLLIAFFSFILIKLFVYDLKKTITIFQPVFLFLFFPLVLIITIIHIINNFSLKKKLIKTEILLKQCCEDIMNLRQQHSELSIIPFKYQTPVSTREMLDYLHNYRASNWTEAVNILEDTIYKNNMLYLQTKQAALLNQQIEHLKAIKANTHLSTLGSMLILSGL